MAILNRYFFHCEYAITVCCKMWTEKRTNERRRKNTHNSNNVLGKAECHAAPHTANLYHTMLSYIVYIQTDTHTHTHPHINGHTTQHTVQFIAILYYLSLF